MMETLCGWTNETWGKWLIAGTLIVVGGSHFGYLSMIPSMSVPVFGNVGNLMGIVAVVGGVCMVLGAFPLGTLADKPVKKGRDPRV